MGGNVYAIDQRNHIHVFTNGVAPEPDGTLSIVDENVARAMLMDATGCERRTIGGLVEEYARMNPDCVDDGTPMVHMLRRIERRGDTAWTRDIRLRDVDDCRLATRIIWRQCCDGGVWTMERMREGMMRRLAHRSARIEGFESYMAVRMTDELADGLRRLEDVYAHPMPEWDYQMFRVEDAISGLRLLDPDENRKEQP